ncbi:MAG: hypothetical protein GC164_02180 [Phycisphaera sp.]|nr:hypothetical protein [Phycisphaera sp.]
MATTTGNEENLSDHNGCASERVGPSGDEAGDLKVYRDNSPDPNNAGQGLACTPFLDTVLKNADRCEWLMSPAEQMAMIYLLEHLRPRVAIEIGTRFGGSLQFISRLADKVYSLDIDPQVPARMAGRFKNVEYITGPSQETLPALLDRLDAQGITPEFCLVDGDHTTDGVREDINILLRIRPRAPMAIVMHDSFNPICRRGLRQADWAGNEYVHMVELDFVSGVVNPAPITRGELWGGLALGFLKPVKRSVRFEVSARAELTFQAALTATRSESRYRHPKTALRRFWRLLWGRPLLSMASTEPKLS